MATRADQAGNQDTQSSSRTRDGRLQQIRERVDRVERELDAIMELVGRMQVEEPPSAALDVRALQRLDERGVTSAVWPMPPAQEDSASL
jgi:hypothetical protein